MKKNDLILKKFGKRVRELRLEKGFSSQVEFAARSGIDRSYIGQVERGERNVALVMIEKIAKTLKVSVDELFQFPAGQGYNWENKIWVLNDKPGKKEE